MKLLVQFVRSLCLKEEEHEISGKTVVLLLLLSPFQNTEWPRGAYGNARTRKKCEFTPGKV